MQRIVSYSLTVKCANNYNPLGKHLQFEDLAWATYSKHLSSATSIIHSLQSLVIPHLLLHSIQ